MMHGGAAAYLIAVAAGYLVLERSDRHKGSIRRIGQWVGGTIIVAGLLAAACSIACGMSYCPVGGTKRSGYCPMVGKPMPGTPAQ